MDKYKEFVHENIGYLLNDIIKKYDFKLIDRKRFSYLIYNDFAFEIFIYTNRLELSYIYKDKVTGKYYSLIFNEFITLLAEDIIMKEYLKQNKLLITKRQYNYSEYIMGLPFQMFVIDQVITLGKYIDATMDVISNSNKSWMKEYNELFPNNKGIESRNNYILKDYL